MLDAIKEMLREVVADDEFFNLVAQANMRAYAALVNVGFTKSQAIQIVAAQGVGPKAR